MIASFGATDIGSGTENQDAFLVSQNMFVVADGHGRAGARAAAVATAAFVAAEERLMTDLFNDAEETVRALFSGLIRDGAGGTTLSALRIATDGSCEVGHVGDSEVRYFDELGHGVALTADHSPCSLEEFHRVRAFPRPARFEFGRTSHPVFLRVDRDWVFNEAGAGHHCTVRGDWSSYLVSPTYENLAITRAIGDFSMKEHGVIAEPTIMRAKPPTAGIVRAIVMASDGLWDAMQYAEVGAIVRRPDLIGNAEAATKALMVVALETARRLFGTNCDNITAVVVYVSV
jgi:serine/threonine protein phosphatase PrpC